MTRRPEKEGLRWLEQASEDLKGAEVLFGAAIYHLACFTAQQVAEKALKAFLYFKGETLVTGHSVEQLCWWASEHDAEFEKHRSDWAALDGYYVAARYPNALPDSIPAKVYGERVAQHAVSLAKEVVALVTQRIKPELV